MRQLKIRVLPTVHDDATEKYFNDISHYPSITVNEEVELAQKIRKGGLEGKRAKDKLVTANLRFVVTVAKQFQYCGLPLLDLINEGNIGLISAADRFDETRGFKFITYAIWWIRQAIMQAVSDHGRMIHLPLNQSTLIIKIENAKHNFEQANQRKPSVSELSTILNVEEDRIKLVTIADKRHTSTDAPVIDEDVTVGDMLRGEDSTDKQLNLQLLHTDLDLVLNNILSKRDVKILYTYFGINQEPKTLSDIADMTGLTRERVRQLIVKAIDKLKSSGKVDLLR